MDHQTLGWWAVWPSDPAYYIEDCRISILSSSICLYAQLSLITSCCCCCIEFMTLGPSIYKVSIKTGWVGLEKRLVLLTFSTVFMLTWVLYICVGFWLLAYLTTGWEENKCCYKLSKCTKWQLFHSKLWKLSFWVKIVVILSVAQLVTTVIFFQLGILHLFHGPTAKNKYKCRTPSPCIMQITLLQNSTILLL